MYIFYLSYCVVGSFTIGCDHDAKLIVESIIGWKHIKPPQNCNHMYNFFAINCFDNIWISLLGYFFFLKVYLISFRLHVINYVEKFNIEEFKCMECIHDKIIPITKFENLNIYFKTRVVHGILGQMFLWCMILIYIN